MKRQRFAQLQKSNATAIIATALIIAATTIGVISSYVVPEHVGNDILIAAIGVCALGPILVRLARRTFDIFEPVVLVGFAFLVIWVARPTYNLVTHYSYFGVPLWPQYRTALLAASVSVSSFQIAYHSFVPARVATVLPSPRDDVSRRTLLIVAAILTCAAVVSVAVISHLRGGFHQLFVHRGVATVEIAPFIRESFLAALPAVMLFLTIPASGRDRAVRLLALLPLGVIGVMSIPGGDRRYILPVATALVTFFFLRRGRRPRLALAVVLVVALLVFVIDPLRAVRTGAESYPGALGVTLKHPLTPFTTLLRTGDTAMIDTVAMESAVMGKIHLLIPPQVPPRLHHVAGWRGAVPYRHGTETLSDTLLAPIPRQLWPSKPLKTQTILIDHFYGTTPAGGCITQCPAFSFVGEAYADFGLWSVAVLSGLFGVGLATGYRFLRLYSDNRLAQAAYASGLWLAFQPWEAGMSIIMHSFILTVSPILLVAWFAGRRRAEPAGGSRPASSNT